MMLSKIHRATVTDANRDYIGSITIDADLLRAAGLAPHQQVDVLNVTNGHRLTTYTIEGAPGSGAVTVNGAAARLAAKGDLVIVVGYGIVAENAVAGHQPKVVFVDQCNRPVPGAAVHTTPTAHTAQVPHPAARRHA
jgi:aspartate 1-decarboxylase